MQWEYLTVKATPDWGLLSGKTLNCDEINRHLNRLGAERWELTTAFDVNAFRGETNEVVLIFRRPKQ